MQFWRQSSICLQTDSHDQSSVFSGPCAMLKPMQVDHCPCCCPQNCKTKTRSEVLAVMIRRGGCIADCGVVHLLKRTRNLKPHLPFLLLLVLLLAVHCCKKLFTDAAPRWPCRWLLYCPQIFLMDRQLRHVEPTGLVSSVAEGSLILVPLLAMSL